MMHFYAHSLWSLLASFSYRYHILKSKQPTARRVFFLLLLVYTPSFFQVVTFSFASASREEVVQMLSRYQSAQRGNDAVPGIITTIRK